MIKILSKAFWRIILPFILAILLTIADMMEMQGRLRLGFFPGNGSLYGTALLFCIFFTLGFRNTLRWGKEAEEYAIHLKDAEEFEKERRRRSTWIER